MFQFSPQDITTSFLFMDISQEDDIIIVSCTCLKFHQVNYDGQMYSL